MVAHARKRHDRCTDFDSGNNAAQGQQGSQPQSSGGLFGSLNKPSTTAPASGGLFGSSTAQSSQPQSGGLFGSALGGNTQNQTQSTPQSGGLVGGAQSKPSLLCVYTPLHPAIKTNFIS